MTELRQKALDKMNAEMSTPHDGVLDYIHNSLCDSEDEELLIGIITEGKTIAGSFEKMRELAKKIQKNGYAMFSPEEGMNIVIDYFKSKETEVKPIIGSSRPVKPQNTEAIVKKFDPKKAETKKETSLMNIFDFLDEPTTKTQTEIIAEIKEEAKANAWEDEVNEGDGDIEDHEDKETETD